MRRLNILKIQQRRFDESIYSVDEMNVQSLLDEPSHAEPSDADYVDHVNEGMQDFYKKIPSFFYRKIILFLNVSIFHEQLVSL